MNRPLPLIAGLLGVLFLAIAAMYWFVPASGLPSFFPGFKAGSAHIAVKHAIGSLIIALVLFAFILHDLEIEERPAFASRRTWPGSSRSPIPSSRECPPRSFGTRFIDTRAVATTYSRFSPSASGRSTSDSAQIHLDVRERLCAELLRLSHPSGQDRIVISPPPTHLEIALRIGTRREAVTKSLPTAIFAQQQP
jgi:hypothetical protein